MDCVPAPPRSISHAQIAARLIRMAQDAHLAGQPMLAVGLLELAYAVLDGAIGVQRKSH